MGGFLKNKSKLNINLKNKIMESEDYEVLPIETSQIQTMQIDAIERANVDTQVATAKRYPRNVKRSIEDSIFMVTFDAETASSCGYSLPRGGKPITGPSVHLAKVLVSNWGNIRTEAKVVQITDKQVISRGICWDLEKNVASAFEVRRSIINKTGSRFSDDMITVTGNAANSIAYRNAVFSVIPKSIVDKVYREAQHKITGDLSDETKLNNKKKQLFEGFKNNYDITEVELVKLCGKQTINQIKAEEIALIIGIAQSLKDGDTTVEELMKSVRKSTSTDDKIEELKKKKKDNVTKVEMP